MLKVNDRTTEAVAALIYNNIYELSHPSEGAWSIEERRDDRAYLAFAKGLIEAVHESPDASDDVIMQRAVQLTNQSGFSWQTIVIDQEYFNLPDKAAEHIPQIRHFITYPGNPVLLECEFLDLDEDVEEKEQVEP